MSERTLREWAPRVGALAAWRLRTARRARARAIVAGVVGVIAAPIVPALVLSPAGVDPTRQFVGLVALVAAVAVAGLGLAVAGVRRATGLSFAAVDAAFGEVRPRLAPGALPADDLRRAMRSPRRFDAWAAGVQLAPAPDGQQALDDVLRLRGPRASARDWAEHMGHDAAVYHRTTQRLRWGGLVLWCGGVWGAIGALVVSAVVAPAGEAAGVPAVLLCAVAAAGGLAMSLRARTRRRILATLGASVLRRGGVPADPARIAALLHDRRAYDLWLDRVRRERARRAASPPDGDVASLVDDAAAPEGEAPSGDVPPSDGPPAAPSAPEAPCAPGATVAAWTPNQTRPLLAGPSARQWRLAAVVALLLALASLMIMSVVIASAPSRLAPGFDRTSMWGVVFAGTFAALAAGGTIIAEVRMRREYAAGYNTMVQLRPWQDVRTAVDLVDDRTGRIVRLAGERPLSAAAYDERLRRVRS